MERTFLKMTPVDYNPEYSATIHCLAAITGIQLEEFPKWECDEFLEQRGWSVLLIPYDSMGFTLPNNLYIIVAGEREDGTTYAAIMLTADDSFKIVYAPYPDSPRGQFSNAILVAKISQ